MGHKFREHDYEAESLFFFWQPKTLQNNEERAELLGNK